MRNLKRTLSLLLAVVMVIGLMVVGAGAVSYNDFSDRGEIVNKDAVSMLTTLGIIEGKPDGSYAPTEGVDRAQMAKMISTIKNNGSDNGALYENVNSGLTDIVNHWAKGHINYCYTTGIIAGRGNGIFDPNAGVTGTEAAKMLLVAIGYDPQIEGLVGTDWEINTNALATRLGIYRNFTKDVTQALNRDDAALLIYNALDVEMIQQYQNGYALAYEDHRTILSSVYGVIRVEGVVAGNEWAQLQQTDSDAALREGRTTLEDVVWYDSTTANTRVEEGVEVTDPVTFNVSTPVEYMGKAVTLYVEKTTILANSKVIGVATNDEMNTVVTTADGADKSDDVLGGTGVDVNKNTEYYVNYGYCDDAAEAAKLVGDCGHDDHKNPFDVKGVTVEVIDNDDDGIAEYVLYTQETLSEVSRYNDKDELLTFYKPALENDGTIDAKEDPERSSVDFADVVFNDEVSTGDLILYVEYGGRTYVSLPEIVTGTMARVDRDKADELYITLESGEEYYESHIRDVASDVDADVENFADENAREIPGFDTEYDFILDSNGYLVAVRPAEEVVTNFALVLNSAWTQNALTRAGEIEILMADGTTGTYDLDWNESRKAMDGIKIEDLAADDDSTATRNEKLEIYLGTRDVNRPGEGTYNETGMAAGSLITYTLDEDENLTIKRVYQGNQFEKWNSMEIKENDARSNKTANVGDDGTIMFMGDPDRPTYQYNSAERLDTNAYTSGRGSIEVTRADWNPITYGSKTYAIDRNTIAFYYDGEDYAVATGWQNMEDMPADVNIQVYPALEKTANGVYEATNLAEVIIFSRVPDVTSDDYMLVLNRNAYTADDELWLNVVFEDGTVAEIQIDENDADNNADFEDDADFMKAYPYAENSDGTYDIVRGTVYDSVYADLYRN
ncbi:S-layer homology domain-containing protein, partial [uncultured Flavonifractor sp.]|uniref:S-layer homology domain-containing protein n=1 Tax=uncultured Flavonifractor sp. TaxID=1193534 RepID=UPI0025FC21D3